MTQVSFYRKKANGLYDGHILVEDGGITDMVPSYRVLAGKNIPPMFPVSNHPQRLAYNPQQGTYYFVPAQEVVAMSSQERQNLAKMLYHYESNIDASSSQEPSPANWCPSADPCLPLNNVCCPSEKKALTTLQIVGIVSVVGALALASAVLLKRHRK